jgi:hypothetical protein
VIGEAVMISRIAFGSTLFFICSPPFRGYAT